MKRGGHSHEDVIRAFARRCYFTCRVCGRPCVAGTSDNHRFDCCGVIVAHVMGRDLTPVVIEDPMRAGYLTGPSQTTPRRWSR